MLLEKKRDSISGLQKSIYLIIVSMEIAKVIFQVEKE